jgi:hypothetical protein
MPGSNKPCGWTIGGALFAREKGLDCELLAIIFLPAKAVRNRAKDLENEAGIRHFAFGTGVQCPRTAPAARLRGPCVMRGPQLRHLL